MRNLTRYDNRPLAKMRPHIPTLEELGIKQRGRGGSRGQRGRGKRGGQRGRGERGGRRNLPRGRGNRGGQRGRGGSRGRPMVGVRPTLASDADRVGNRVDDFELLWPPGETVNAYTDVGAGDGSIGRAIAGVVDAGTVHLFDVEASPDVTVVKQEEPLPLPDDSQDLVTALVTAHHVLDIDAWLDDVARVVKPSGYVYVREHDVSTMQDAHYINWVHLIDIARRRARRELASFHAEYYSSDDLEDTLSSLGIELVGRRVLSPPNPQRLYNALFQKTGDAASPTPLEGVSVSLGQSVKAYNHSPELRNKVQKLARRKLGARVNPAVRFESPTRAYDYLVS